MSYVDALYDKDRDIVHVVERVNGSRILKEYPAEYTFYKPDPNGSHKTASGLRVKKCTFRTAKEYQKEKSINGSNRSSTLYESDFTPIARCLEKYYLGKSAPDLQVAFFDIESDYSHEYGYAPTDDPFNKITAISLYLSWLNQPIVLAIPPQDMSMDTAKELISEFGDKVILYTNELQMITDFLDLIHDADVISGWNTESYDIPYIINRIKKLTHRKETKKFCLWGKYPKKRHFEKYGSEQVTYDLVGRIHLDYMLLYMKYIYHELHSYALDAVAEYELGEHKVPYDGTLDELYNKDFKKFIGYSLQDSVLLYKLDQKLKYISLASEIAHANTVLIPKTMGSVAVTEQGIINESHQRGLVVADKIRVSDDADTQAAGAYVATPKAGLHKWIGSVDINSLYPSVIRALNMGPETIVGQLRPTLTNEYIKEKMSDKIVNGKKVKGESFADAWNGLFGSLEYLAVMDKRDDMEIMIDWENGGSDTLLAKDIYNIIFSENSNWVISANGTIYTLDVEGIIPGLLARWYAERKVMQRTKQNWIDLESGIKIPDRLLK